MKVYWQMKRFEEWNLHGFQAVVSSILRHTWYLDPTLVVFALADEKCRERGDMAKKLYSLQRCPNDSFPGAPNNGLKLDQIMDCIEKS